MPQPCPDLRGPTEPGCEQRTSTSQTLTLGTTKGLFSKPRLPCRLEKSYTESKHPQINNPGCSRVSPRLPGAGAAPTGCHRNPPSHSGSEGCPEAQVGPHVPQPRALGSLQTAPRCSGELWASCCPPLNLQKEHSQVLSVL